VPYIEIRGVSKAFADAGREQVTVVDDFSLEIDQGRFVALFGPNGSGKTTLLQLIAGLLPCDAGTIAIGGKPPEKARIGFVFQNYRESLFPWMTNLDNIAFSLGRAGSRGERRERTREFVAEMQLDDLPLDRYPYQCSGGQQQLVALLRELILRPDVLLMDEPFASLDYERRLAQYERVLASWDKTQTTVILVSHELDEAIYLADTVLLLSRRPATICGAFEVPLPRPREPELLETEVFFELRRPVLQHFLEIIRV
jgi:NitT/TauT family transport system ATP-binding protein